jgi:signal transduction histidine kinase
MVRLVSAERRMIRESGTCRAWTPDEETVEALVERARADRMEALGRLAGGVAHAVNNPMTYVIANIELVSHHLRARRHNNDATDDRALLDALNHAVEGMHRIRRTMRMLSIFSGALAPRREVVDLRAVLSAVTQLAYPAVYPRARLVLSLGEVPPIDADEARIAEAMLNLIVNAAQATPEGNAYLNEVRVATFTDIGPTAVVEIADTGCGIEREDLAHVFDPFFTRTPIVTEGLGLSFVYGVVKEIGGTITVKSAPAQGCIVRITIPARPTRDSDAGPAPRAP